MKSPLPLAAFYSLLLVYTAPAVTTHYVDAGGSNPIAPFTSWATAATNIQDAMDATGAGDIVLVTNGIYQYGGATWSGSNRVHVINGASLQSVNGPAVTAIKGYWDPATTNGPNAVRCVYLTEFSSLCGFTLTNGASGSGYGGGVISETFCVISNCVITGNASAGNGAGSESINNSLLVNCVLTGNTAMSGGAGGGAFGSTLVNCVVSNNYASNGGGVGNCKVYDSLLTGNGSTNSGATGTSGGAAYASTLYNCTLAGNFSRTLGAAEACALINSIIYDNVNGIYADCYMCSLTNCCTTLGLGNPTLPNNCLSNAPGFVNPAAGDFHLTPWSRCIDTGNNTFATNSTDLDGNPRIVGAAVDLGAYENQSPFSGTAHYVSLTSTNPVAPYTNWPTAATNLQDAVASAQAGEFVIAGDGVYTNSGAVVYGAETNRVALTNAITLVSSGGPQAAVIAGGANTRCVYVGTNAVLMGFTLTNGNGSGVISGDITNEQSGGGAWCAAGGVVSNCVVVGNYASANYGFGGGVFGGTIYNSTLTNNNAAYGGGAAMALLSGSTIISNSWHSGGHFGGGLYQSTASNCVITANWSYFGAGGVYRSTLYNCTVSTNSSSSPGAGVYQSTLFHCLIISNNASYTAGGAYESMLDHCVVSNNHGNTGGTFLSTNYFCTLSGNSGKDGGGAYGGISSNCIFTANSAGNGGGALNGTLYNCLLYGNTAITAAGAQNATLYNCTVCNNTATNDSGGTSLCSHYNTIVYNNIAPASSNWSGGTFSYCCTVPATPDVDSITNPPVFVNPAAGDYHQQANSPTINGGINIEPTGPIILTDLDGNPRIVGGIEDMGAYEYQGSNLGLPIPIPWLRRYGLPLDGSADYLDSDGDGMNNWQEWIAGTVPVDATSVLKLTSVVPNGVSGTTVTWQSVSGGITYYLQRSSDLGAQPAFTTIRTNIAGQPISTSYTDTTANNGAPVFYRVGVQ